MSFQETIFAQLVQLVDHNEFRRCVGRYDGDYRSHSFRCWDQFLCLLFAQWGEKQSLRSTVFSLQKMNHKLYHMGIKGKVSLSALSDANQARDWRIYQDHAQSLIARARFLYQDERVQVDEEIEAAVYAFDSSTISLCLSIFPWAHFRKWKGGIKLHTQVDLRGFIPVYIDITEALGADVKALDKLNPEEGSIWLFDRGYLDFFRLYRFDLFKAFFVTRAKDNTCFKRVYSRPVDKSTGLLCDQIGYLGVKKVERLILESSAA
jgi:hypothetical protein